MAGNGWKWLKIAIMDKTGWTWKDMAGCGLNCIKLLKISGTGGNG